MMDLFRSPFAIGVCLLVILAWAMMLVAIFCTDRDGSKTSVRAKEERDGRF
jgi:hypothetical protein